MANMIDAIKDIVESFQENSETKEELLNLKKELANEIITKFEEEKPDLVVSLGKDIISDYLVDEWWSDKIHDAVVEKGLESLSTQAPELKKIREKLNKAKTADQLNKLKSEILWRIENTENQMPTTETHSNNTEKSEESYISTQNEKPTIEKKSENPIPSTYIERKEEKSEVIWFNDQNIISAPFLKNPQTGVTRCSRTAQNNWLQFGFKLPAGNAFDAGAIVPQNNDYKMTIPEDKLADRPSDRRDPLTLDDFYNTKDVNVADIYPNASKKNRQYGHRAIAFKNKEGDWMVLDPYVSIEGFKQTEPKPLEKYMEKKKIFKSHFYAASNYEKQFA